ncbi:hypothetical protein EYF80_017212 [Liparis tanakae]|uniref:Uncharacterized protein n=1 Tax=Liparis tanakae TaxID=230148 RepID=A0A4Z2I580_9TELE|nr:hypothetical protein EYF80_017212 [Liparis tanakae]
MFSLISLFSSIEKILSHLDKSREVQGVGLGVAGERDEKKERKVKLKIKQKNLCWGLYSVHVEKILHYSLRNSPFHNDHLAPCVNEEKEGRKRKVLATVKRKELLKETISPGGERAPSPGDADC